MGKSKPKAPPLPDPAATARAQGEANVEAIRESARLSQMRQETPWGTVEYHGQLGTPTYTQKVTIPDEQRVQLALQNQLGTQLAGLALNRAGQIDPLAIEHRMRDLPERVSGVETRGLPQVPTGLDQRRLPGVSGQLAVRGAPGMVTALDEGFLPRARWDIGAPGVTYEGEWDSLTDIPGAQDFGAERERVEGAIYGSMMSRLEPAFQERRAALEQSLANRGLPPGSEAWNAEMANLNRAETDARQQALSQAIQMGGTEQGRLFGQAMQARGQQFGEGTTRGQFYNVAQAQGFGQEAERARLANALRQQMVGEQLSEADLTQRARQQYLQEALAGQGYTAGIRGQLAGEQAQAADMAARARGMLTQEQMLNAQLANQARQQEIQERMLMRTQPMNELAAILQGSPALQQPGFMPTPQYGVQPTDVMGAEAMRQQAMQNQYQQQLAANQGMWNTIGNLGATAAGLYMFSDRRLKRDILKIGETVYGLGVYVFRYLWDDMPRIGLMADEVKLVLPDAVTEVGGYLAVDYRRVK